MTAIAYRLNTLPWTPIPEDEQRYRRIFRDTAIVLLVLGLIIPWLPIPEVLRERPPEVPTRYAKLLLERKAPPPPPPPPIVQEVTPEPLVAEPTPVKPVPVVENEPVPQEPPREAARERAAKAGLMAFADSLSDLRENDALKAVGESQNLTAGEGAAQHNQRSIITSRSGTSSGGINTAGLSRNTGGGGLEGRATTQVASSLGSGGGGDGSGIGPGGDGRIAARSREEIEMIFDKNKGAIYALYSRALRKNPALRGKLVLRLTIAPSGEVTDCEIVSSELNEPGFEKRLVARVRMFRFEDKDVSIVTTTKPIDFFPA